MPPKISDHHRWSAVYLREAAKVHDVAAQLIDEGKENEARQHAYLAHDYERHALEESGHATKRTSDLEETIDWEQYTGDEEEPKPPKPKHRKK